MSHEKTPMQQLLEKLEYAKKELKTQCRNIQEANYARGYLDCLQSQINDIELQMLPIEKQCISDAFDNNGMVDFKLMANGEQYYNEKFVEEKDTTAHLVNRHGDLDDAGAYAEDDKED